MKGLLRKEWYLLAHSSRSVLIILLFLALIQVYAIGVEGFVVFTSVYCGMLVISTFSFDESAHWMRAALTAPISRRNVVAAKYGLLLILAIIGAVIGAVGGGVIGSILGKWSFTVDAVSVLGITALVALSTTVVIIGTTIPLLFRFGAERGRLWLFLAMLVPAGLVGGGYYILRAFGVVFTESMIMWLLLALPFVAAAWTAVSYMVSCRIVEKMDV